MITMVGRMPRASAWQVTRPGTTSACGSAASAESFAAKLTIRITAP